MAEIKPEFAEQIQKYDTLTMVIITGSTRESPSYANWLIRKQLIMYSKEEKKFVATPKGLRKLAQFNQQLSRGK